MRDSFSLVYRNIKERKTRSVLTVLGITVGIGAVIALISIGFGMQAAITDQLIEMADIIIAKHRNGPTGQVKVRFRHNLTRFENLVKAEPNLL